ncbi:hypothetical protein BT69DRAFT_1337021 [Atractiella rhizophila]|nr:hypothetical protein BT69DRAFT_1337021 [Atractiella rhizophila]
MSDIPRNKDGSPDKRFAVNNQEAGNPSPSTGGMGDFIVPDDEVIQDAEDLAEEGGAGGRYKPKQHGGKKLDGGHDKRVDPEHGFGGDTGPDPHIEGKKGGKATGRDV